LKTKSGSNKRS